MMKIFNIYLNVGGMLSVAKRFNKTKSFENVISEHNSIAVWYKKDFTRYKKEEFNIFLCFVYKFFHYFLYLPSGFC